jgi:poly(3-hydroxybutyrate) depolymerase
LSNSHSALPSQQTLWAEALRSVFARVNPVDSESEMSGLAEPAQAPDRGKFLERSYSNPAGRRAYKLYVPGGYHGQAIPLLVMLHGCSQSPDDFAAGTRMNALAEQHTCLVAYPAQLRPLFKVLELVQPRRPAPRRGRALTDRRHHP